jgi:hypothetical protein
MPAIPIHLSELIEKCLNEWFDGSGKWTPTLHRLPKPILDNQYGPTLQIGGLLLAAMTKTTSVECNQMYLVDTFIVRCVLGQPVKLAFEGEHVEPVEFLRLERRPGIPEREYIFGCASTFMSVYFGLVAGDLARFGRDERVPECRRPDPMMFFSDPGPDAMVSCPQCGGMLFPGQIDHPWPVYRHNDMRLIYRA